MASRAQYVLRVAGRAKGDTPNAVLVKMEADLKKIFKEPASPGTASPSLDKKDEAGWPSGFVLEGYNVCQWKLTVDEPYKPVHKDDAARKQADGKKEATAWPEDRMINFRAEIHHDRDGSLFLNRQVMVPQVNWFYHNRLFKWHADLFQKLKRFNADYAKHLLEPVWFREWQWYCGNGGC